MKKIIFLLGIVIIFLACNKEGNSISQPNIKNGPQPNTNNPSQPNIKNGGNQVLTGTTWWLYTGPDYGCIPAGNNCGILPPVVVRPDASMIADLNDAEEGGPTEVATVFSSREFEVVYDNLDTETRSKLVSGDYYIKKNFEDDNTINYIFGTENPLSSDNMEFALQFTKAE